MRLTIAQYEALRRSNPSFPPLGYAKGGKRKAHRSIPRPLDGEPVRHGVLTLTQPAPSVNSIFHNRKKGRGKTLAYRNWRSSADQELRDQPSWHVPGKVKIQLTTGGGVDLDNRSKAILDALVGAGRIEDDSPKYVVELVTRHDASVTGVRIEIEGASEPRQERAE